jgi:hypothetical protein
MSGWDDATLDLGQMNVSNHLAYLLDCGLVGREDDGGCWEGRIEVVANHASPVLRTPQETVQPNREDLRYWATGLSAKYLEGALERALRPPPAVPVPGEPAQPTFDEPAPPVVHVSSPSASSIRPHAVLDPFRVYAQGEDLRKELTALEPSHLRNIIQAHGLVDEEALDLGQMSRASLVDLIVSGVRKRGK